MDCPSPSTRYAQTGTAYATSSRFTNLDNRLAETNIMAESLDNPFDSPFAKQHSAYFKIDDEKPILEADPDRPPDLFAAAVAGAFRGFVRAPQFPCVGAKSAVMHENDWLGVYPRLGSAEGSAGLSRDLFTFTQELANTEDENFKTFIACFREPLVLRNPRPPLPLYGIYSSSSRSLASTV